MSNFLSKFNDLAASKQDAEDSINRVIEKAIPLLKIMVRLPARVNDTTPDQLFLSASVLRSNLDTLSSILCALLAVRLQVKNANRLAESAYKSQLKIVYAKQLPDIVKARGYAEKEMLAQGLIAAAVIETFEFWKTTLENVDDSVVIIQNKMRMFKGGLDTIITMLGLLKAQINLRGITVGKELGENFSEDPETTEGITDFGVQK